MVHSVVVAAVIAVEVVADSEVMTDAIRLIVAVVATDENLSIVVVAKTDGTMTTTAGAAGTVLVVETGTGE